MVNENYWPHYTTYTMIVHSVLSTFLLSVAIILSASAYGVFISWLLCYARDCHYYADIVCCARFLQLGFLNRVMLLHHWSYHYRNFMVLIMNSWIVTVYSSAPWKLICSTCHSFFSFDYPGLDFFISNSASITRKAEDAYPTGTPCPCTKFLVEPVLLLYFCYFLCAV